MNKYSYVHIKDVIDIDKFNDEKCEVTLIHEDNVKKAINELPDDELIVDLSDMFKIFGDQTRVKILMALESGELCVCDIAAVMNMSQSAISHQLRVLKQSNIVKTRRQGKVVYYSISDDHVKEIFDIAMVHVQE
ncbi:metalloregulator ArsR/SmtB family transcription factor [Finegoldia magna]|uniref:Transcriptional regulator, ArsR family n=1 Tax=Finegoldia magna ATCC 53516 TaxID=525282 RepID=D6S9C8_FINMA|nr:metalloregulator ArsR/SmtB family transcription factor [Finegoldia magna]EFH93406.1 transcriptional regulator, ArsR family [Finegoldia magna ATCC 53516]MDU2544902.1 metalloregulator ArsR/SmtB family transcription factor [Finegoldia magna]MDU5070208.1 metalloregulator ArsR/SmtB family transcription factor [Finegoldia magna]MDU5224067.1 metalloregulator ArsR/SmtB family transcription factor [Finegoldia magna]MDU5237329.1 metalloregulator ArsR/SmtB family transcription factor [Finegoldia magna